MTEHAAASKNTVPQDARTGAQLLVEALAAHGVDTVFGIPGTHNLDLFAALAASGIRTVNPRHEQGAGFAADGYARLSGRPGVCITTTGPGILNAVTAVAQAYSDSIPLLTISPGLPLAHPSGGNGYLHEVKDQLGALEAVAGAAWRIESLADIPAAVTRAFALLTGGRPRPVHLEIPLDLLPAALPADGPRLPAPVPVLGAPLPPDERAIASAAALLQGAARPVIIAGGGASHAAAQVLELARLLAAPVLTTANGKGIVPTDDPLFTGAGIHEPALLEYLARPGAVLVAIGTELAPADMWAGPVPPDTPVIRIDVDPHGLGANATATVPVLADAAVGTTALTAALRTAGAEDGADVGAEAAAGSAPAQPTVQQTTPVESVGLPESAGRLREAIRAQALRTAGEHLPVLEAIDRATAGRAVLAADSNQASYYGALGLLPAHRPRSLLYPSGLGTLGYGLPAGIGAKLAEPEAPVVVLEGDGGIMFTVSELACAAHLGLALPIVVVDNGGYGEIRDEMVARHDPVQAVDLPGVDFVALARAMGCAGEAPEDAAALREGLQRALAADRPTVLHVRW
jgi:thiamine pyrophosphate-dependent acetolactate synthase large subunit-like protein